MRWAPTPHGAQYPQTRSYFKQSLFSKNNSSLAQKYSRQQTPRRICEESSHTLSTKFFAQCFSITDTKSKNREAIQRDYRRNVRLSSRGSKEGASAQCCSNYLGAQPSLWSRGAEPGRRANNTAPQKRPGNCRHQSSRPYHRRRNEHRLNGESRIDMILKPPAWGLLFLSWFATVLECGRE